MTGRASSSAIFQPEHSRRASTLSSPDPIAAPRWAQQADFTPWLHLPQNPSPAATQSSIDPSPGRNKRWLSVVKTLLLVLALGFIVVSVYKALGEVRSHRLDVHLDASWIAASLAVTLAAFFVLVLAWRYLLVELSG